MATGWDSWKVESGPAGGILVLSQKKERRLLFSNPVYQVETSEASRGDKAAVPGGHCHNDVTRKKVAYFQLKAGSSTSGLETFALFWIDRLSYHEDMAISDV